MLLAIGAAVALQTGCTVTLPFQHRVAYDHVANARSAARGGPGVTIRWEPSNFPERVDTKGASGFVGGGSRTRVPTGIAISQRITELLDSSVGVRPTGAPLVIEVIKAESTFEYSAGIFNVTPSIDRAGCDFEAKFTVNGKTWVRQFHADRKDDQVGGSSQVALLEKVWDDIAVQVHQDILKNM
jgi:hypothetical protein